MFDSLSNLRQRVFLAAYSAPGKSCGNVKRAATAAKIDRETHYYWLANDATYKAEFESARKMAGDILVGDAVELARQGVKELVLYQGEPVLIPTGKMIPDPEGRKRNGVLILREEVKPLYKVTRSTRLHLALLAALLPEQFGKKTVEHTGEVNINLADRMVAARKRLAAAARERTEPGTE